ATNPQEQRKLLDLFQRPLGKRVNVPLGCQPSIPPYPDRFDLVWAVVDREMPRNVSTDEIRDSLGLVHFCAGEHLVCFAYPSSERAFLLIPTCIEAMGGWAFWPPIQGDSQRTVNYHTGVGGPREFVHSA